MTTITLNTDESLAGAIRASAFGKDAFVTLRDQDGVPLWAGVIQKWQTACCGETTVELKPIEEHIDQAVEIWSVVKRAEIQSSLRNAGIL